MGRLFNYPNDTNPKDSDELIIDGSSGTRNLGLNILSDLVPGFGSTVETGVRRRNWWRGYSLGNSLTDEQKEAISGGLFKGGSSAKSEFFIGDHWVINGITWRIVDMDYWYRQGDTPCNKHHLVIMPDSTLYTGKMNDENTTEGGYVNSKMRKEGLEQAKEIIYNAFGEENILNHREYLCNAVTDGRPSGGGWFDSKVEISNEIQMYGCFIRNSMNTANSQATTMTMDNSQFSAMRLRRYMINPNRQNQWLRDVVFATHFASINGSGDAYGSNASGSHGVRPVFGLIGG